MKKLMLAAAVLAAGVAVADIESANVVGYESLTINAGQKFMQGYQFVPVAGGEIDLQDIKPYKGDTLCDGGEMFLGWWNPEKIDGDIIGYEQVTWMMMYFDPSRADDPTSYGFYYDGAWTQHKIVPEYKDYGEQDVIVAKTFANGRGFYIEPNCTNPKITISGAVIGVDDKVTPARIVPYEAGKKLMISNPFPTALSLAQIRPYKGDTLCDGGEMFLGWWNPEKIGGDIVGYVQVTWMMMYFDPSRADDPTSYGFYYDGAWTQHKIVPEYKDYGEQDVITEHNLIPGAGFYMEPNCTNPKLYFPNPFAPATED